MTENVLPSGDAVRPARAERLRTPALSSERAKVKALRGRAEAGLAAKTQQAKPQQAKPQQAKPQQAKPQPESGKKKKKSEKKKPANGKATMAVKAQSKAKAPAESGAVEAKAKVEAPAPFSLREALAVQMRAGHAALALPDGAHAVHQARVALKRMRVLARMADHALPEGGAALQHAAHGAMRRLAAARDLAAMEQTARLLWAKAEGADRMALNRIANDLARRRLAEETPALADAAAAFLRLAPIVDAIPELRPEDAKDAGRRMIKRARNAYRAAHASNDALLRHDWRKREKDQRIGEMMMAGSWPRKTKPKARGALTEALGRERDANLLLARLNASSGTPKSVTKLVKAYRRARAARADKIGARLYGR